MIDVYRGAERMLIGASRGHYRGASVAPAAVAQALSATSGLQPEQLATHTRAAVTGSTATRMRGGLVGTALEMVAEVALGEIFQRLGDAAVDWIDNRSSSEKLIDDADDAADALTDITDISDSACTEILTALQAVISQLCAFLARIDPLEHPHSFAECIAAGSQLIDAAGTNILELCHDRDTAVTGCLDEFLTRGRAICEEPAPKPAPAVVDRGPAGPGGSSGSAATPMETPTTPQSAPPAEPAPPPPAPPAEPAPPPKKPVEPVEAPTTPQTVTPPDTVECPPVECEPVPAPVAEECPPAAGEDCCGVLGLVGLGVLLVGAALLIDALADFELPLPTEIPEPEAPAPEPAPEPPPPPKQNLTDVPEPPPPPKKTDTMPAHQPAPAQSPNPPATSDSSAVGARKAGAW
ncbi:MAG: hypothetical protein Q4G50_12360 [Corynebacterium sp.]|uniref:hypothetical protein n=1 Tax=Corynebacterium sp. TaxID=1720 RepID=UPI0026DEE1A3|nr:hypothetical protein [Corynebacterium sp.]MDO5670778.1 hypothetical protein [Corynebacterium sp.]